jgi:hypothetical protein
MEPRKRGSCWVPTRSAHAEGPSGYAVMARRTRPWRGRRPLAGTETCGAAPGRPCLWPGAVRSGPHGEPEGYARDGRRQGVGPLQSTEEAFAQGSPQGTGGAGGGKGRGPRGTWRSQPGAGPSAGVSCPRRSAAYGRPLRVPARRPEAGARCGSAARRDRCGGCWVTGIPTATFRRYLGINLLFFPFGTKLILGFLAMRAQSVADHSQERTR